MGGRLSRKKRGYNVNDPKDSKPVAESTDQPEVKQDEPESRDVSKEQLKTPAAELPDQQPDEAPKTTGETTAGNQTDLTTVTIEGKAGIDPQDNEAVHSSEAQQSATFTNSVKPTEELSQEEHLTKAEVESSVPGIGSSAAVHVPVPSEEKPSDMVAVCSPDGEAQEEPTLGTGSVAEVSNLPTEERFHSDHPAPNIMEDSQQSHSSVSPDAKVETGQFPEEIAEMSMQELTKTQDSLSQQPAVKEQAESSDLEIKSEPGVENVPHEDKTPKLSEITEETAIDVVLKNEMAKCADLEKNVLGPCSKDDVQEKLVSESILTTVQIEADIKTETENSDNLQDGSAQGLTTELLDQDQVLEGSGNLSVDTLKENSVPESVTDVVPADPKDPDTDHAPENTFHVVTKSPDSMVAECAPELITPVTVKEVIPARSPDPTAVECAPRASPNVEEEVPETMSEPIPELSCQDRAEVALLNSSSEKIPAIKLTVCTEATQEEKVEMDTELMTKESTDVFDTTDSDLQNEVPPEKQSTSFSTELSLDPEIVEVGKTSELPVTESRGSPDLGEQGPTDLTKTEAAVSTETENGSVVDGGISQSEKTCLGETPVSNGTPLDTEVGDFGKSISQVEVNGQNEPAEEYLEDQNCDVKSDPTKCKSIEQVDGNRSLEEPDQILDSGLSRSDHEMGIQSHELLSE
ncbi:polycystin-1-like protein 3 [Hemiscyllium ocellatum]|uniref:polycystin-1-like protein 3 n=1 Tax=Hemiscyllium ocellatum TaxID=170820 RepID=UPI00296745BB|nr:polycystin-1-like protein 3 [Hemiscyllium ocellatum]